MTKALKSNHIKPNGFLTNNINNSHRLYRPMIKQKSNDGAFEDKDQITLEKRQKWLQIWCMTNTKNAAFALRD